MSEPLSQHPGDPLALEELAGRWMGLATAVGDIIAHLGGVANSITGPDHWVGDGASRFAEWWMNIDPELRSIVDVFQANGVTLRRLADDIGDAHRTIAATARLAEPLTASDPLAVARVLSDLDQPWQSAAARFRANSETAGGLRTILRDATSARFARAVALMPAHGPVIGVPGVTLSSPPTPWYDDVKQVLARVGDITGGVALVTMLLPGLGEVTVALELAALVTKAGKTVADVHDFVSTRSKGSLKDILGDTADIVAVAGVLKVAELVEAGKLEEAANVERFFTRLRYSDKEAARVTVDVVEAAAGGAYLAGKAAVEELTQEHPWTIGAPWPEAGR
ncbi:MAG: hypothetical protein JWM18_610 [Chloroflexi bacterium]|jgi:hypothetical protein|nr:hypothetical protein [Chloroflexota bacterium]